MRKSFGGERDQSIGSTLRLGAEKEILVRCKGQHVISETIEGVERWSTNNPRLLLQRKRKMNGNDQVGNGKRD